MSDIAVPVSVGEMLDKLSILRIKSERISDPDKLTNIRRERDALSAAWQKTGLADAETERLEGELKRVNEALWEIEDDIRMQEARKDFGEQFIKLARRVYYTNDERAAIKRTINEHTGSTLMEEKSYADYQGQ